MIACVVLAAGASRRMGFPKAMLDVGGEPAVQRILRMCGEPALGSVVCRVVVVAPPAYRSWGIEVPHVGTADPGCDPGAERAPDRSSPEEPPVRVELMVNPQPESGRTGSIQCGISRLQAGRQGPRAGALAVGTPAPATSATPTPTSTAEAGRITGTLIWPVDVPLVTGATVRLLAERLAGSGTAGRVVPVHDSRGGHPVGIGSDWWPLLMEMGPDEPLRRLFRLPGLGVERIEVSDPGVNQDLNTPEDVLHALGRAPRPYPT